MFAAINGLPIQVIATVITYQPFDLIVGPTIRDFGALAGKRIAYVQGTNAHFYLDSLIKSEGLTWRDIVAINMSVGDFVPSLVGGAVDAFVWSEPLISATLKQGQQFRRLHKEELYFAYGCVSALRATIDKQPDLLARALKSVVAADEVIKTDPSRAQKILSDTLKLDPPAVAAFWADLNFEVIMDKPRLVRDFERQARWAIDNKLTKAGIALPDFSAIVTDEIYGRARAV